MLLLISLSNCLVSIMLISLLNFLDFLDFSYDLVSLLLSITAKGENNSSILRRIINYRFFFNQPNDFQRVEYTPTVPLLPPRARLPQEGFRETNFRELLIGPNHYNVNLVERPWFASLISITNNVFLHTFSNFTRSINNFFNFNNDYFSNDSGGSGGSSDFKEISIGQTIFWARFNDGFKERFCCYQQIFYDGVPSKKVLMHPLTHAPFFFYNGEKKGVRFLVKNNLDIEGNDIKQGLGAASIEDESILIPLHPNYIENSLNVDVRLEIEDIVSDFREFQLYSIENYPDIAYYFFMGRVFSSTDDYLSFIEQQQ